MLRKWRERFSRQLFLFHGIVPEMLSGFRLVAIPLQWQLPNWTSLDAPQVRGERWNGMEEAAEGRAEARQRPARDVLRGRDAVVEDVAQDAASIAVNEGPNRFRVAAMESGVAPASIPPLIRVYVEDESQNAAADITCSRR
jgi:hypothetical protein